jgi:4-amino-4-deoxy-L-arabinose transferase-like glycosyltransferase
MLVKGSAPALASGGAGWLRITVAQVLIDVFVTGVLVWRMARRMAGARAGLIALALSMFMPFTWMAAGAGLTECLATALATATVASLVLLDQRPRLACALGGVGIALSTLTRPDGILLAAAVVPAAFQLGRRRWRTAARLAAVSALGFAVVFAPWPLRNYARFGEPWPFGTRVDRYTQPVAHWKGPQAWMRSYARDGQPQLDTTSCIFTAGCRRSIESLANEHAFDDDDEKAAVGAALDLRDRYGLSFITSDAFQRLADQKLHRHPLRVLIGLPLRRAWNQWTSAFDEILQKPPFPSAYGVYMRLLDPIAFVTFLLLVAACVLLIQRRETRAGASVLVTAIAFRAVVLAWAFYSLPRYVREVQPLAYVLIAVASVTAWRLVVRPSRSGQ